MPLMVGSEDWPLAEPFAIARGVKDVAVTAVARISDGRMVGQGESTPYARYGEDPDGVVERIWALADEAQAWAEDPRAARVALATRLPAGAARNALDCALWDLEAKRSGRPVVEMTGLTPPERTGTATTLSLGTPEAMAASAARRIKAAGDPGALLKAKLGSGDVALETARIRAIREAAPKARLILDANEGWTAETLEALDPVAAAAGTLFIEQPLKAGEDAALSDLRLQTPLCADESVHVAADLSALKGRYQVVNVKLDKTGGLTEAIALREAALAEGFGLMIGCMVATSLAMAPAYLLTEGALAVDLDGPLLLARDRDPGIRYAGATMFAPPPALWG
ncbi:MAG: N-acetyl-D-Glu racemase DgcA [Pseudomonadota bacterium]